MWIRETEGTLLHYRQTLTDKTAKWSDLAEINSAKQTKNYVVLRHFQ